MELLLARPRGFCAGVERAIELVEMALYAYGAPVYVYHQIVHNEHVVASFAQRGVVFVDDLDEIPHGAVTVFSAHGVPDAIRARAGERRLVVTDATCPLISKVHQQAQRYARSGRVVLVVGHAGHDEIVGIVGSIRGDVHVVFGAAQVRGLALDPATPIAYVTQTTLSAEDVRETVDALKAGFSDVVGPGLDDICYATHNRQQAVRRLAGRADVLVVVGARNSSNSHRLAEVGARYGMRAHLVQDDTGIDPAWLRGGDRVGVTAGASTPEVLVRRVIDRLTELGAPPAVEVDGPVETVTFRPRIAVPAAAS